MPPVVDKRKSDPLMVLLDEVEILSAQTRLMELYLKRAHTAAFGEVEKIQEEFRAKVNDLKTKLENNESAVSNYLANVGSGFKEIDSQNETLPRQLAEQQNLIEHHRQQAERLQAEIISLRERLSCQEAELAEKAGFLKQSQAAAHDSELNTQAKIRGLAEELAQSRESAERQRTDMERAEHEGQELRQRLARLESVKEQLEAQAAREIDAIQGDAQAKIAALQSEVSHKTALLTQNQAIIARLEQDNSQILEASKRAVAENYAPEIARRDSNITALCERVAELEALAEQQRLTAADELSRARASFTTDLAALRSELGEKQEMLEQGHGALQSVERDLRNRNRELQGKIAAKESVVESLEHNLRQTQSELLVVRDKITEKEKMLADWQARVAEKEQAFQAQRDEWQRQLSEKQLLMEHYSADIERMNGEMAQARQAFENEAGRLGSAINSQREVLEERNALREQTNELNIQVATLTNRFNQQQAVFDSRSEALRQAHAQIAELSAAHANLRQALDQQQTNAQELERDFAKRSAELQEKLERKEHALLEREAAARVEPTVRAQIEDFVNRLREKDRVLEARALEISMLQARVENLSGQTARLEAAHKQALTDARGETGKTRQTLEAEIVAARSESAKQQALLAERQAAFDDVEERLNAEIDALKEQSARHQAAVEKQIAEQERAETEARTLREHIAQLESTNRPAEESAAQRPDSKSHLVLALEQRLQSTEKTLADREATIQRLEQQIKGQTQEARLKLAENQGGAANDGAQLQEAQDRIVELLERLAQLEAARHTLQENAGHELHQLRDSFENRIAKLRMELAAKESAPVENQAPQEQDAAITHLEEGFQRQIQELQGELAEKHSLLENRNEELIKVKAEMDALQDHLAQLRTSRGEEDCDVPFSVELREEDAVDAPRESINPSPWNSTLRPDPLAIYEAAPDIHLINGTANYSSAEAERTNRFTQIEGRVRSWNPEPEHDSAFGGGRRWNMGIFKRRWKS